MATDIILSSNNSSVVLQSLASSGVQDLSYELQNSYPNLSKECLELQPRQATSGSLFGKTVRFDLPRGHMLRDLMLETNLSFGGVAVTAGDADAFWSTKFGLSLIESIELRTRSRSLFTVTDDALRSMAQVSGTAKSMAISRRAMLLNQTTGLVLSGALTAGDSTDVVTYTPIFSAFFEQVESNFDLGFYEQLEVVVKYNSQARSGFNQTVTDFSPTLWMWTYVPEMKYYSQLRAKNAGRATPMNALIYDSQTETTLCTGTTSNTADIKVNYPVFVTFINLIDNTAAGLAARKRINQFDFSFTGRNLYEDMPQLIAMWEQESQGNSQIEVNSDTALARQTNGTIACFWSLDPNNRTYNSGSISYNQINNPKIVLSHETVTAANTDMRITHVYWAILELDSSSGRVTVSTAT